MIDVDKLTTDLKTGKKFMHHLTTEEKACLEALTLIPLSNIRLAFEMMSENIIQAEEVLHAFLGALAVVEAEGN